MKINLLLLNAPSGAGISTSCAGLKDVSYASFYEHIHNLTDCIFKHSTFSTDESKCKALDDVHHAIENLCGANYFIHYIAREIAIIAKRDGCGTTIVIPDLTHASQVTTLLRILRTYHNIATNPTIVHIEREGTQYKANNHNTHVTVPIIADMTITNNGSIKEIQDKLARAIVVLKTNTTHLRYFPNIPEENHDALKEQWVNTGHAMEYFSKVNQVWVLVTPSHAPETTPAFVRHTKYRFVQDTLTEYPRLNSIWQIVGSTNSVTLVRVTGMVTRNNVDLIEGIDHRNGCKWSCKESYWRKYAQQEVIENAK